MAGTVDGRFAHFIHAKGTGTIISSTIYDQEELHVVSIVDVTHNEYVI
jgi:hypothetical protein